jgi:hypothetical protein
MKNSDQISGFVHEALSAGRSRTEIQQALNQAGWTNGEISTALKAWDDTAFLPPVPRPRPFLSAREAFLHGVIFIALVMTAWHLVMLGITLIDYTWLDPGEAQPPLHKLSSIRWSMAALIVFFPLFTWLNRRAARARQSDKGLRRSVVRKWVGYVILFLAALALLGNLVFLIFTFLDGEATLKFLAKSAVVAAVSGVIFLYYRAELAEDDDGE